MLVCGLDPDFAVTEIQLPVTEFQLPH